MSALLYVHNNSQNTSRALTRSSPIRSSPIRSSQCGAISGIVLLAIAVTLLIGFVQYLIFMVVPNEVTMGPVQRIFYFHVGSAFATYAATLALLAGALGYLSADNDSNPAAAARYDALQTASAEIGLLFCSIVLATGMIWAQSAWNIAFSFREPRLVSTLVLWLMFVALVALRRFSEGGETGMHCAIFGILGALLVPIVVYSVKFLSPVGQLHPVVVEHGGLQETLFRQTFWLSNLALVSFAALLIWIRSRLELLR